MDPYRKSNNQTSRDQWSSIRVGVTDVLITFCDWIHVGFGQAGTLFVWVGHENIRNNETHWIQKKWGKCNQRSDTYLFTSSEQTQARHKTHSLGVILPEVNVFEDKTHRRAHPRHTYTYKQTRTYTHARTCTPQKTKQNKNERCKIIVCYFYQNAIMVFPTNRTSSPPPPFLLRKNNNNNNNKHGGLIRSKIQQMHQEWNFVSLDLFASPNTLDICVSKL